MWGKEKTSDGGGQREAAMAKQGEESGGRTDGTGLHEKNEVRLEKRGARKGRREGKEIERREDGGKEEEEEEEAADL